MPAVSEPLPRLPHTWRPLGVRVMGSVLSVMLLVVCAFAWFGFDAETRARFTFFQRSTLVFLGLLAFTAGFALTRSRAVATLDRLIVVNGYRRREFEWAEIIAVHLPPGRALGDARPRRRHHHLGDGDPGLRRGTRPQGGSPAPGALRPHDRTDRPDCGPDRQSSARIPQEPECSSPHWPEGASVSRCSPERNASAGAVIGSTASDRRAVAGTSSAL